MTLSILLSTEAFGYENLVRTFNVSLTGISDELLIKMVQVESGGNPKAVSPAGAKGLFQLMPVAVREARTACPKLPNKLNLLDSETNVKVAICYLIAIRPYWNTIEEMLAYYNGGWKARDAVREGKRIPFKETRNYLKKILETK